MFRLQNSSNSQPAANALFNVSPPSVIVTFPSVIIKNGFDPPTESGEICTHLISHFMAKSNIDKKGIAQSLFLNGSFTQEEIANKVGTTRQTVSRWVRDGAWEELKASRTITTEQLIAQYKRQLSEINKRIEAREPGNRFPTAEEADAIVKTAGAVKKLEQDIGVSDCVSVGMRFLAWLRPVDAEAAATFNDYFDAFIKDQAGRARK